MRGKEGESLFSPIYIFLLQLPADPNYRKLVYDYGCEVYFVVQNFGA